MNKIVQAGSSAPQFKRKVQSKKITLSMKSQLLFTERQQQPVNSKTTDCQSARNKVQVGGASKALIYNAKRFMTSPQCGRRGQTSMSSTESVAAYGESQSLRKSSSPWLCRVCWSW